MAYWKILLVAVLAINASLISAAGGGGGYDAPMMIKKSHLLVQLSVLFATFAVIY